MLDDKEYLRRIATKLRRARLSKKKTQEFVALETGMDRAYISELENGHKNPSIVSLKKISIALEVPISEIVD